MATFRKRGDRWQVQVRRLGHKPRSKSFDQRRDAERWAVLQEREIDLAESRGEVVDGSECVMLGDLLRRYREQVVPSKRAAHTETYILLAFERRPLASRRVCDIKDADVAAYRDSRLEVVGPAGVAREMRLVQHAIDTAVRGWGFSKLGNPFKAVKKPPQPRGRERRLMCGEEAVLLRHAADCQNPLMVPLIKFALATGMRQGEMIALKTAYCDLEARVATLPLTKNNRVRTVPLSRTATNVLKSLSPTDELFFPITREAVKQAWSRLIKRAGLVDLHFHDLRHEAISRMFELNLEMPEVMMISGHTDPRMLLRYTHLNARRLVTKLDAADITTTAPKRTADVTKA